MNRKKQMLDSINYMLATLRTQDLRKIKDFTGKIYRENKKKIKEKE